MAEINFARLQAVIQNMSAGVLSTDREQRILWANESFSRITGHALDEVIGRNPIELLLAPSADRGVADQVRARLASFEHFEGEVPLRRKDGVLRWVHLSTQPIVDASGRCTEYVAVLTDVTQRRDADEALRRSNLLLEATQTIAQVGGWSLELETRTLSWSAETFRIHETSPQQYQPELATALAFYAPESRPAIESAMRRAMEIGEDYDMELQVITARGRRLWVHTTGRVSRDGERIVRLSGAIRDVTGRRLAEAALRASESRLRSMVDHAPMGIMLCDPGGRVSYVNDALLRMCGLARDEVQRAGSRLTVHPDDRERLARDWGAIRGRVLPFASEGRYLRPDGSVAWFEATTAPIVVDGKLASHVVMVQDVTVQLSLEREVVDAAGREQDRLGMELHDGLGQELTGLAISLASLVRKAEKFANPLRKDLREMAVLSSHSVAVCRQIAQGLAPMQLARGGLRNALRALAVSARSIHGV